MFDLKPLSPDSIDAALAKAKQYRLLNEPQLAESICLDILEAAPSHQEATILLLLSLTDQFENRGPVNAKKARALLPQLQTDYEKAYYAGLICERQGKAAINKGIPDAKHIAYEWFRDAMEHYEEAEPLRPAVNDDAILRWNTCARLIERYRLEARQEISTSPIISE